VSLIGSKIYMFRLLFVVDYRANAAATTTSAATTAPGFGNFAFGNPAAAATSTGFVMPQPAAAAANLPQKTVRFELPVSTSVSTLTSLLASTTAASTAGQLQNTTNHDLLNFVFFTLYQYVHCGP